MTTETPTQTESHIEAEAERLLGRLMHVDCSNEKRWNLDSCRAIAPLTLEIRKLKEEQDAIILAHSYVEPEIVYGVADFTGDSYKLSVEASRSEASTIVFAGVVFMAETAKILSPQARVLVPDIRSGCSLADSLTGDQLRTLKKEHPGAATVCYVNCNADVKAESDVCVTSTNVYDIVSQLEEDRILFVPDRLMGENIRVEMRKRGIDKSILTSDGTCMVHDQFTPDLIDQARARYPGLKVVVGSTGAMMEYVKATEAPYFMMLTECGLVSRLEVENPEKRFIGSCKLCPYMKMNSLEKIRDVLKAPRPEQEIQLEADLRKRAEASLRRMIALTDASR
jgi:quinolinate synthase